MKLMFVLPNNINEEDPNTKRYMLTCENDS